MKNGYYDLEKKLVLIFIFIFNFLFLFLFFDEGQSFAPLTTQITASFAFCR